MTISTATDGAHQGAFLPPTSSPIFYSHVCAGFKQHKLTEFADWTVGSTISYTGGFKINQPNTAQVFSNGVSSTTTTFTYTVVDAAIALTVSAAAMSGLSSVLF